MRLARGRLTSVCGAWLMASIVGVASGARAPGVQDGTAAGSAVLDELSAEGQVVFGTNCVSCHDAAGGDGQAPALSGHPSMGARDHIVRQILRGNLQKGMPAFAAQLSDRQVAAVATYIRNAWDNAHGVVIAADVKKVRDEVKSD